MSDEDVQIRASQARTELNLTEAAFARMRANALEAIARSKPNEGALREHLYQAVTAIDAVKRHLLTTIQSAEVADFAAEIREQLAPGA